MKTDTLKEANQISQTIKSIDFSLKKITERIECDKNIYMDFSEGFNDVETSLRNYSPIRNIYDDLDSEEIATLITFMNESGKKFALMVKALLEAKYSILTEKFESL